jgi:hypothetical protein
MKDVGDVLLFVAGDPSSAVDQNGCRKRATPIWDVSVERQNYAVDPRIWNVFELSSTGQSSSGADEQQES